MTVLIKGEVAAVLVAADGVVTDLLWHVWLEVVEMEEGDDNPVGNLMVGVGV